MMFSSVREVKGHPERGWSASDNCKLFQTLQLFPLPFTLTENRISQPHVVPAFQPSQKSTNKQEALNKKIYYVAPRLHSMLPVYRLIQKGPRKRHLAAEACTTTDPPTRECFRFLLGPPTYVMIKWS